MFQRVEFLSRPAVEQFAEHPDALLVSITDPETPQPAFGDAWRDVLELAFFDADDPLAEDLEREGFRICRADDAERIVEFLDAWHAITHGPHELITHCEAGVSRSAAVARFAAARYGLDYPWEHPAHNRRVLNLLEAAAARRDETSR